jgi:RNA polymerase sigma-70 factor, ECF subfamily
MNSRSNKEIPTLSANLLSQIHARDSLGWTRLVSVFAPVVYAWCRKSGVSEFDAPDLVQDVFATVARKVDTFKKQKEGDSFRSWLATITRCRVIDHIRREKHMQKGVGGSDALHLMHQAPEQLESTISWDNAESLFVRQILDQVECEFEPTTWQAFRMIALESCPASDVSTQLGISVASVYQAKSRVLRRLRTRMSELV